MICEMKVQFLFAPDKIENQRIFKEFQMVTTDLMMRLIFV